MNDVIEDCKVKVNIDVAWGEMDAFQHVNNIVYFRYFETVRIAYFEELGILEEMKRSGIGPILASTQCKYKAPLTYPDSLIVATKIDSLESDRFLMKYYVQSEKTGRIAAEGEGQIVFYDYNNHRRHDIPSEISKKIRELDFS